MGSNYATCSPDTTFLIEGCYYFFEVALVDGGYTKAAYHTTTATGVETLLDAVATPDTVVTSLDIHPAFDSAGIARIVSAVDTRYDVRRSTSTGAGLAAAISALGIEHRIVTALSYTGPDQVLFLSYGWGGAASTVYETEVATVTQDTALAAAQALAGAGYFITGFGESADGVYQMVGTRAKGSTVPHQVIAAYPTNALYAEG